MLAIDLLLQPLVQQTRHFRRLGGQLRQVPARLLEHPAQAVALAQDLLQHRPRFGPDVDLRVQRATDPLDVEQGLLQQDQLRLQGQLVALGGAEQLEQHLGQRHLRQRPGEVRLADAAHGGLQLLQAHRGRHPAGLHMQLGNAPVVTLEDGHEVFGQVVLILRRELADDAEVQRDDARVGLARRVTVHPDVAGVGIGVEEVVAEHLGVEQAHGVGSQRAAVDSGGIQGGDVIGRNAVHALQGQCAFAAVVPQHFGDIQLARALPVAAQHAGIGPFPVQVQLGGQGGLDLGHHLAWTDLLRPRMGALDHPGQGVEQGDVLIDLPVDARAQYLDHHLAATGQARGMHLGNRGRGQRGGIEGLEGLVHRTAQGLFHQAARQLPVKRLYPVLQQHQLGSNIRRHQIAAGGQHLAKLDEDRPQLLQGQAQAHPAWLAGDIGTGTRHKRAGQLHPARGRGTGQQVIQAIAQQDRADAARTQQ